MGGRHQGGWCDRTMMQQLCNTHAPLMQDCASSWPNRRPKIETWRGPILKTAHVKGEPDLEYWLSQRGV